MTDPAAPAPAPLMDRLNAYLSSDLHNYTVCALLLLYAATVVAVLVYPQDTRLSMAKDVGTALMGVFGIVAGAHTSKAIATTRRNDPGPAGGPPADAPPTDAIGFRETK